MRRGPNHLFPVIPAQAGIQGSPLNGPRGWTPAFAGVTEGRGKGGNMGQERRR